MRFINNRNSFLVFPRLEIQDQGANIVEFWWEPSFDLQTADLYSHMEDSKKGNKLSCDPYKGTNPNHVGFTFMTSSNATYLPKSHLPNTITLGIWFQYMTGGGGVGGAQIFSSWGESDMRRAGGRSLEIKVLRQIVEGLNVRLRILAKKFYQQQETDQLH